MIPIILVWFRTGLIRPVRNLASDFSYSCSNSCKSCGVEHFEPADYDDNGGDGDGDGGGDGDSGYADDMGDELRCQIIIMPAFLHWQA